MTIPSENLAGMPLKDGWRVVTPRTFGPTHSGGGFSTGYDVVNQNGRKGFLKAINLSPALQAEDVLQELAVLLEGVNHERYLLDECKKNGLDRVATTIHEETLPMGKPGFPVPVPCFVFDAADHDLRDFLTLQQSLDHARAFFLLHQTTLALHDLHAIGIAHQDVKPSNLLMHGTDRIQISDLGRSSKFGRLSLIDGFNVAGDRGYSPPELLYGHILTDWNTRRFGTDLYMLGGLVTFFVAQQSVTSTILSRLPNGLKPGHCDFKTV